MEDKTIKIGRSILHESDLEIPIQYNGELFTLKYPEPWRQAAIEAEIARRLNGFPRASFSPEHLANIEAYVTVDLTYIPEKCPTWFKGPWMCYDEGVVVELIKGYFLFRDKFTQKLRDGGFEASGAGVQP